MNKETHPTPPPPGSKHKRLKLLVSILIILSVLSVIQVVALIPRDVTPPKPTDPPAQNVEVMEIRPEAETVETIKLPGVAEANRVVKVPAEVAGRVEEIACEEGRPCKAGDKLLRLNTELYQAEFDRAAAQVAFDTEELKRTRNLLKENVTTEKELDRAENNLKASEAVYRVAKYRLERARIKAPIDGILNELPVEKGEYVREGDRVAEIVDIETVKVVAEVPERDIQYVRLGDRAAIEPPFLDDASEMIGEVTYISELADARTRTSRVEISVDNRERVLRTGQIVRVILERRQLRNAIMVPLSSVIPLENDYAVYIVNDDKAKRRSVKLGFLRGRNVQIVEGLEAGDRLIVKGHNFVGPDQAVSVQGRDTGSERGTITSVSAE